MFTGLVVCLYLPRTSPKGCSTGGCTWTESFSPPLFPPFRAESLLSLAVKQTNFLSRYRTQSKLYQLSLIKFRKLNLISSPYRHLVPDMQFPWVLVHEAENPEIDAALLALTVRTVYDPLSPERVARSFIVIAVWNLTQELT
jgi:hypothetical protein